MTRDLEEAIKKYCKSRFSPPKSGTTYKAKSSLEENWSRVLSLLSDTDVNTDLHVLLRDYLALTSTLEIDFVDLVQRTIAQEHLGPQVYLFFVDNLLIKNKIEEAIKVAFGSSDKKFCAQFLKYFENVQLSSSARAEVEKCLGECVDNLRTDLVDAKQLATFIGLSKVFLLQAREDLSSMVICKLVEAEERIANDSKKTFERSLAKECFEIVARAPSYEGGFRLLVVNQRLSTLVGFIGRRDKYLREEAHVQLEMLKTILRIGEGRALENLRAWKGLHFGHFAQVVAIDTAKASPWNSRQVAKELLRKSLESMQFGKFMSLIDEYSGWEVVNSDSQLFEIVATAFRKKKTDSTLLISELMHGVVEDSKVREAESIAKIRQECDQMIQELQHQLDHISVQVASKESEIAQLVERVRIANSSEIIGLETKLYQAQLQSLIGLCRLFEEVRILDATEGVNGSPGLKAVYASGQRILAGFGISIVGVVGDEHFGDRQLFDIIGNEDTATGTVVVPAYVRQANNEVLVRGMLKVSS